MRKRLIISLLALLCLGLFGFKIDTDLDVPVKKVNKAIQKIWKIEDFSLEFDERKPCDINGKRYLILAHDECIGTIYVGRVNSCRSGGCDIGSKDQLAFEYFDYFLLTDVKGEVLWVKIYNYQATQGHEVMSRGWLNQFKGAGPNEKLVFGSDIDAISGATVSARSLTNDIQDVLSCGFEKIAGKK